MNGPLRISTIIFDVYVLSELVEIYLSHDKVAQRMFLFLITYEKWSQWSQICRNSSASM